MVSATEVVEAINAAWRTGRVEGLPPTSTRPWSSWGRGISRLLAGPMPASPVTGISSRGRSPTTTGRELGACGVGWAQGRPNQALKMISHN